MGNRYQCWSEIRERDEETGETRKQQESARASRTVAQEDATLLHYVTGRKTYVVDTEELT